MLIICCWSWRKYLLQRNGHITTTRFDLGEKIVFGIFQRQCGMRNLFDFHLNSNCPSFSCFVFRSPSTYQTCCPCKMDNHTHQTLTTLCKHPAHICPLCYPLKSSPLICWPFIVPPVSRFRLLIFFSPLFLCHLHIPLHHDSLSLSYQWLYITHY